MTSNGKCPEESVSIVKNKRKWNFHSVSNILCIIYLVLLTIGLWACAIEINKLKQTTQTILDSISNTKNINGGDERSKEFNIVFKDIIREHKNVVNGEESAKDSRFDAIKKQYKREALPTYERKDLLSSNPTDIDEFCWTFLYDRCGSQLPGAPGVGPPGPPGPPGTKGEAGRPGAAGHMGPPGVNGVKGQKGLKGETGRVGEPGSDGPRGPPGGSRRFPGVNGIQGANGRRGKRGLPGKDGTPGKDGIPGMPGQKGQKGDPGDPGGTYSSKGGNCSCSTVKGEKGERGHIGFYGYKGNKGVGIKGEKGQRGLLGFEGYKGEKGEPGMKGQKGYGMQGYPGPIGPRGEKGTKGDPGYCKAYNCADVRNDKYVRRKATEPYTVKETTPMNTTELTTTMSTVPPSLEPRTSVCRVKKISTPIFIKRESSFLGSIFGDPLQPGKFWVSRDYFGQYFEEYDNLDNLKKAVIGRKYNIAHHRYSGTQHAIYNNSIYYHYFEKQHVVRYNLSDHAVAAAVKVIDSHFNDSNFLYKDSQTYYDITADENGVWIVYGRWRVNGSYIHVMKADLVTLDVIRVWRLPVEIGTYKNGFIACGVLYLVQETGDSRIDAEIGYAYDFYHDEETEVNIKLKIPFGKPSMFTFYTNTPDRKNSLLLSWDNGNIIKYHMLF